MKQFLENKLKTSTLQTRVILSRARLAENRDWETPIMNALNHFPFYYHIGSQVSPNKVFELGFGLGLTSSAFLQNCPSVKKFVGYQLSANDFYYSARLGSSTLKEYFKGNIQVDFGAYAGFEELIKSDVWDLCLITQKVDLKFFQQTLDNVWVNMASDAFIIVDHLHETPRMQVFESWCKTKNREFDIYDTKYTIGVCRL